MPIEVLWLRAQAIAAALPAFSVRAARRLRQAARGTHPRRRAGPGDSFWQFRPYMTGEPAGLVDWRRSARSETLYVRQREWETAQTVWFWVDGSPSMQFRSRRDHDSKADRAALLALAAARLVVAAGEKVALFGTHRHAAGGNYGLSRLVEAVDRVRYRESPPIPEPHDLPRHAQLVLIGDFLGESAQVDEALRRLVSLDVAGHLLQILDPVEEDFPFRGRISFESPETGERILLDRAEALASGYERRIRAWTAHLGEMCRRSGWTHCVHRSDRSPATALLALLSLTGQSL
ncbi:MAG: DUF58 domain-containing protein [Rhodothalassiaceae bacterium]